MNENVDMDAKEVAALEERLYSQCHHSYEVTTNPEVTSPPMADNVPSRIVSNTSVVNNPQSAQLRSKMKRYWATTEGYSASQKPCLQQSNANHKQSAAPSEPTRTNGNGSSVVQSTANESKKMFTMPYQSLLGNSMQNWKDARPAETVSKVMNEAFNLRKAKQNRKLQKKLRIKKNHQQHPVQRKLSGLMDLVNRETSESRRTRFQEKRAMAIEVRKLSAPRVVAQVCLDSSDDEPKPTALVPLDKVNVDAQSDGEADEVLIVPLPEPPRICIDCSDDEVAQDSFAFPQATTAAKKATVTKFNSPRCLSPSNSSIMSDDFIGHNDRSRLNESFTENVPNDDELECSIGGKRGEDMPKGNKGAPPSRDQRAPSISSEETICTSSDTTDHDKHRQETGKGNQSKASPPSHHEIVAGGENGKKDDPSNQKGSSQAAVSNSPLETITEPSRSASPSGTAKKGSAKKATPSVQATKAVASNARAKCKSPISIALELARKHFEANDSSVTASGSAKKKSKKDRTSDANRSSVNQDLIPTKRVAKKGTTAGKKVGTDGDSVYELIGASAAKAHVDRLPLIDDSVSSESDYELTIAPHKGTGEQIAGTSLENEAASKEPSGMTFPRLDVLEQISSESEYEESFSQAAKSTPKTAKALPAPKRVGRKRKQYNSETFSDEDFACMLTDIVRAISDADSEEEEDEEMEEGQERQEKESNHAKEVPGDAGASTSCVNADLDCTAQKKQTKVGEPSAKKRKGAAADASKAVYATIVSASKPNGKGQPAENCSIVASSTAAIAGHGGETPGKQTKADGSSSTKKNKQSLDASNATSTSIGDAEGNHGEGGDNMDNRTVASTSTTGVDGENRADGPSSKKKKRSNDLSSASIVDLTENVRSVEMDSVANNMDAPAKRSPIVQKLPDCAWNEEMKQFYNEAWMDEDFNLSSVMQKMPRAKKLWPILQQDLYPDPPKKDVICNNCGERGHMRYKCKNTPKPAVCHMCGEQGHREPRCPRTICLNCGARTRNFVRGCNACARDLNMTCRLCGVRGHIQRSCPDMWRRYHSTTEDNVPLRQQFQTNMKAKFCCICCKSGHQAHICTAAYRIFGQAVPTVHIKSYQQTYAGHQQRDKAPTTVPRYNLLSEDANECELNLHELAKNPNGFYYRFAKSSGLLEKHKQRLDQEEAARRQWLQELQQQEQQREQQQHPQQEEQQREQEQEQEPQQLQQQRQEREREREVDGKESCPQNATETSRQENNEPVAAFETEDSNYSFSGLLAEKERADQQANVAEAAQEASAAKVNEADAQVESVAAKATEALPDFIPLSAEPEAPPLPEQLPPKDEVVETLSPAPKGEAVETLNVSEAKIPLSKANAKVLLSSRGSIFLNEAAEHHSLKLSISFETVGNVLLLEGQVDSQQRFHEELVYFLKHIESTPENKMVMDQNLVPWKMRRAFQLIFESLWKLTKPQQNVHHLYREYQSSNNVKHKNTIRKSMNMVLFGQYGLRDGRMHLNTLRNQLLESMKYDGPRDLLSTNQHIVIHEAFVYIFSSYDHRNYQHVISEYEEMYRSYQLHKFRWEDLRLPTFKKGTRQMLFLGSIRKGLYRDFVKKQLHEVENTPQKKRTKGPKAKMPKNAADDSSLPKTRRRRTRSRHRNRHPDEPEDIVLNTHDQMINSDPPEPLDTAARDFHDQRTIRAMTFPCGVIKPQRAAKPVGYRNQQMDILANMFKECRQLARNVHPDTRNNAMFVMNQIDKCARSDPRRICVLINEADSLRTSLRNSQLRSRLQ